MNISVFFKRVIVASFYVLFLFVPLLFTGDTSELFEFNKMWFTFAMACIIMAAWIGKMVFEKRIFIQRTPLDIPLLLFLLSQFIATIFSFDSHVSFWGYYSRFNGGFLSLLTYIFLYYALISNSTRQNIIRYLQVSLVSGLIAALWALPSHFGYDPTCFVFRGTLDVSCWTDAFQPKVRIFGTLGQPDWLAAHLIILLPLAIAFGLNAARKKKIPSAGYYGMLTILFYIDLLYTRARSGFIAGIIAFIVFFIIAAFHIKRSEKHLQESQGKPAKSQYAFGGIIIGLILIITFFIGTPLSQLDAFTYVRIASHFSKQTSPAVATTPAPIQSKVATQEIGGTDSGKIRLFVWKGAIDAWLHYPLFGTGVETFAFAYYRFRPAGHNMTSEWDYLYNKAHNEYLNYLTTTGAFGLLTYLSIIIIFLYSAYNQFFHYTTVEHDSSKDRLKHMGRQDYTKMLSIGIISAYFGIIVVNFFGFSVVTVNLFLFLLPGFLFLLEERISPTYAIIYPKHSTSEQDLAPWQYLITTIGCVLAVYLVITLYVYWQADKSYAYGMNLDHAGYYQNATPYLVRAVAGRDDEPVFKDELSSNEGVLAAAYAQQKDLTDAQKLAQDAVALSNDVVTHHPNNVVFWKTRVRIFYELAQSNPEFLKNALTAIQKAHELAPTDAKISYNLGLLYGQTGDYDNGIKTLTDTIKLKPDYRDAYYALGLTYHQAGIDKKNAVVHPDLQQKAVDTMHFILDNFDKHDKGATDSLKTWSAQ